MINDASLMWLKPEVPIDKSINIHLHHFILCDLIFFLHYLTFSVFRLFMIYRFICLNDMIGCNYLLSY